MMFERNYKLIGELLPSFVTLCEDGTKASADESSSEG